MRTRSVLFMAAVMLLAAGCQKEDAVRPVATNPFYGIYRPADRVGEAYLTMTDGDTSFYAGMCARAQWSGHRLEALHYVPSEYLSSDTIVFVTDSFRYGVQGRIEAIDSNVIFHYNDRNLIQSIRCIEPSYTKTLVFEYGDDEYPIAVKDSTFWHDVTSILPSWYSEVYDYRLEWERGNLTVCSDFTRALKYCFDYDTLSNPLCGLMWEELLRNLQPNQLPTILSRNNMTGYNIYTVHGLLYDCAEYSCQYADGRITVLHRKHDGTDHYYRLSYLNY